MYVKTSHTVWHNVGLIFSKTELIICVEDKLSPGTNPGFLKSEENCKLHTFIYT